MYFYLLLFFSKAIFWGEDWDPQKMLGTPIWSDMWVPGPRMKNPSAIPGARFEYKRGSIRISSCVVYFINAKQVFCIAILLKMRDGLKVMPV